MTKSWSAELWLKFAVICRQAAVGCWLLSGTAALAEEPRPAQEAATATATATAVAESRERSAVPDGINSEFLNPELDPGEWAKRFEIESREVFAGRNSVLKAVGLQPGQTVADVGSGTGLYLGPFAKAVGATGRVYAIDISPRLVEYIQRRVRAEDLQNVRVVQSTATSIAVEPEHVDRVFVCDTYHHFEFHVAMLQSIYSALKPGGELLVIDFDRIPGKSREWLLTHVRAGKQEVRKEIEQAGFAFVEEVAIPEFQENYFLRFRKPLSSEQPPAQPEQPAQQPSRKPDAEPAAGVGTQPE